MDMELMTVQEISEFLGISVDTLNRWRSKGDVDLPYIKIGQAVRYLKSDVIKWVKSQKR